MGKWAGRCGLKWVHSVLVNLEGAVEWKDVMKVRMEWGNE
jgi:hypothetical protein